MRTLGVAMMMGLAAPAAAATSADQFDLVCKTQTGTSRYRVDLVRNEACEGPCDRVWKMGESSSGELRIIDHAPAYRGDLEERATVSRSTGQYRYRMSLSGRMDAEEGICERQAFTGFPAAKF